MNSTTPAGVALQAHINNVFNTAAPFYDSTGGYNGNLSTIFPRSYDLTVRAKF